MKITDPTGEATPESRAAALAAARATIGVPFADKETPPPVIDQNLVHRFREAINRSTAPYKENGERPFTSEDVPLCVVSAFGQGVWGPFQAELPGYGGYLFGELDTVFDDEIQFGEHVSSEAKVTKVEPVHGRKVHDMLRFLVEVSYTANGRSIGRNTLTLLRLGNQEG